MKCNISVEHMTIKEITGYANYLIMRGQLGGNLRFDLHTPSNAEIEIAQCSKSLCAVIQQRLSTGRPEDIAGLLEWYDIIYRIGYGKAPDKHFMALHRQRLFEAWKAGNRLIGESHVYAMIAREMQSHPATVNAELADAYMSMKSQWVATLNDHGCFRDASPSENYLRLALIMQENLDTYFGRGSKAAKRRWYIHNKVDDLSTLPSPTLCSYRRFIHSLFPDVISDFYDRMDLDDRILSQLSSRTDLSSYDREAYRLALTLNKALATD